MSKVESEISDSVSQKTGEKGPDVSIVMACYNASPYLEEAVRSALQQTDISVEVLIVDDHSSDNSLELAEELANTDPRIRVFQTATNSGPGAARNVGIEHMLGEWYAVLDCDDALEPHRCRTLINAAEATGADMVADDLAVFGSNIEAHTHLGETFHPTANTITLDEYFAGTVMFSPRPNLGFLKPMIRRSALGSLRYRTDLRIGEDDELIIRLLLSGAQYDYVSEALYRYRKHEDSISHRLSADNCSAMVQSELNILDQVSKVGKASRTYKARYSSILDASAFSRSVEALKARDIIGAVGAIVGRPSAIRHYSMPIAARWRRLVRPN